MSYEELNIRGIKNPVGQLADEWALLSAGTPEDWNTMTVSWGGVGEIWGFDAAFVFVRPQRHTLRYIDESELFSLSFGLPREITALCGKISGRDFDVPNGKVLRAGLAAQTQDGAVWPAGAKTVLVCRKAARQTLDPASFLDPAIKKNYAAGDYHHMFVGEIVRCLSLRGI
jgi:flavin reductase (DIM6/NTAB) family NADH-FMN oxidoreductase RutF